MPPRALGYNLTEKDGQALIPCLPAQSPSLSLSTARYYISLFRKTTKNDSKFLLMINGFAPSKGILRQVCAENTWKNSRLNFSTTVLSSAFSTPYWNKAYTRAPDTMCTCQPASKQQYLSEKGAASLLF